MDVVALVVLVALALVLGVSMRRRAVWNPPAGPLEVAGSVSAPADTQASGGAAQHAWSDVAGSEWPSSTHELVGSATSGGTPAPKRGRSRGVQFDGADEQGQFSVPVPADVDLTQFAVDQGPAVVEAEDQAEVDSVSEPGPFDEGGLWDQAVAPERLSPAMVLAVAYLLRNGLRPWVSTTDGSELNLMMETYSISMEDLDAAWGGAAVRAIQMVVTEAATASKSGLVVPESLAQTVLMLAELDMSMRLAGDME